MRKYVFIFLWICFANNLLACECNPLLPISKELCNNYNVVFFGQVDSVLPAGADGIATAYFTINELYKGAIEKKVKVAFDAASACLMSFAKNDQWLIYASYQRFDLMTVNICDHNRKKIEEGTTDIYQLTAHRTFEEEKTFLKNTLGTQPFVIGNKLNKQHTELGPHNDQPTGWNKLILLLISFSVMGLVYYLTRNKKQKLHGK
jgi:hypothetical protein